ncbi:MAG: ABC transporter permease [Vicinamibacterales bacterium]
MTTTRLRPSRGWVGLDIPELLRFRHLLAAFAERDVKLRYRQTLLGALWVVIQPLFAAGIFSFVFGVVAGMTTSSGQPYFVFSFTGLLAWNVFASTLTRTATCMIGNTSIVTKVYFPRLVLPLSTIASTLVDFAVPAVVLLAILPFVGIRPGWPALLVPIWIVLVLVLALGAGLIAAALTIDYRDVQYLLPLLVPFLLYASPVAWEVSRIPEAYRFWYHLSNPLASLIDGFRWSVLGTAPPSAAGVAYAVIASALIFVFGAAVFRRAERRVADVI